MKLFRAGLTAFACVLLLNACQQDVDGEQQGSDEQSAEDETPAVPVETSTPMRGDVYATYTGTAPIEALAEADVIAKVTAKFASYMSKRVTWSARTRYSQHLTAIASGSN